jgi:hypothetical protein
LLVAAVRLVGIGVSPARPLLLLLVVVHYAGCCTRQTRASENPKSQAANGLSECGTQW